MYYHVVSMTGQLVVIIRTPRDTIPYNAIYMDACIRFKRRLSYLVKTLTVIFAMNDPTAGSGLFENSLTLDTFVNQVE